MNTLTDIWLKFWSFVGWIFIRKATVALIALTLWTLVVWGHGALAGHTVAAGFVSAGSSRLNDGMKWLESVGIAFRIEKPAPLKVQPTIVHPTVEGTPPVALPVEPDPEPGVLPELDDILPTTACLPFTEEDLRKAGGKEIQSLVTEILPVIWQIESSGRMKIVGDSNLEHKAYGPLQVRQTVCDDLKRIFGFDISPADCNGNWELSEYAFRLYTGYWASYYRKETGAAVTHEMLARIWNGGPNGHLRSATLDYLEKFRKQSLAMN